MRLATAEGTSAPSATSRRAGSQRVSVTWTRTLALLMVMVLGLGAVAFASTIYQRAMFDETTSRLEAELDATVTLVRDLGSLDTPMGSIFYELGTPTDLEEQVRTFTEQRRQIDVGFDLAQEVVPVRSEADPLGSARAAWDKTADEVMAARELWGTSVVADALAAGEDPFAEQWELLRAAQADLVEVTAESLGALRAQKAAAEQIQRLIPRFVLGALILSLVIVAVSARRLSRRIVRPLETLRGAAMRMRDGDLQTRADLGAAGVELHDLALAMNELAGSLHMSHGLPNRKAITEYLLQRDEEDGGDKMALLFIDLDDFKVVNDSLGHDAGDQLLRIVAARMQSAARGCDLVARLGGDEFAVALAQGDDPTTAVAVARRILASLAEPVAIHGTAFAVSCSIGIAVSAPGHAPSEDLLRDADIAMYVAKNLGKNRCAIFDDTMRTEMLARANLGRTSRTPSAAQ